MTWNFREYVCYYNSQKLPLDKFIEWAIIQFEKKLDKSPIAVLVPLSCDLSSSYLLIPDKLLHPGEIGLAVDNLT